MKRLFVFGTRGFPCVQGGVEKHCENIYPNIAHVYDIHVFRRIPYLTQNAPKIYKNITFTDLPSTKIKGFEAFFHSFLCTIYCIAKRPDIVHIHNIGPGMFIPLLRITGIKVVLTYHSANYEHKKWSAISKLILRLCELIATRWASKIIFVNQLRIKQFKQSVVRKSVFIPNGVTVKTPTSDTAYLQRLGVSPKQYILALGRITQEKGFDYLIQAYAKISPANYKLVIAGGVDHESLFSKKIKEQANIHGIIMPGYVDGDNLNQLYSHAKLFVLPSYNEEFPLVMLEALSYGLPILASDIPSNLQMNLNHNDYFKTGDCDDLAQHLTDKLSSADCSSSFPIDLYSWESISEELTKVYNQL